MIRIRAKVERLCHLTFPNASNVLSFLKYDLSTTITRYLFWEATSRDGYNA
jgi:hypothetical protein